MQFGWRGKVQGLSFLGVAGVLVLGRGEAGVDLGGLGGRQQIYKAMASQQKNDDFEV